MSGTARERQRADRVKGGKPRPDAVFRRPKNASITVARNSTKISSTSSFANAERADSHGTRVPETRAYAKRADICCDECATSSRGEVHGKDLGWGAI